MAIRIEPARGSHSLDEFLALHDRVHAARSARWPADTAFQRAVLTGRSAFSGGRIFHPLVARAAGEVVARVVAIADGRPNHPARDGGGHLALFEMVPAADAAAHALLDAACVWLAGRGTDAARLGWWPPLDDPLVLDEYELLPPVTFRHNPPAYHALLAAAGFEAERHWVDYRAEVRPELLAGWAERVQAAQRAGYDLVPLAHLPDQTWPAHVVSTFNAAFSDHWGMPALRPAELHELLGDDRRRGVHDVSLLAYDGTDPVGVLLAVPGRPEDAVLAPGRVLDPREGVNYLSLGVRAEARRRGVGLALAAHAFLELARRGARHVGYSLVLDDNRPSRRTAERLGAAVCARYVAYRRPLWPAGPRSAAAR